MDGLSSRGQGRLGLAALVWVGRSQSQLWAGDHFWGREGFPQSQLLDVTGLSSETFFTKDCH